MENYWVIVCSVTITKKAKNKIDTLRTLDDGRVVNQYTYLAKDVKGFGGTVPLEIYLKKGKGSTGKGIT